MNYAFLYYVIVSLSSISTFSGWGILVSIFALFVSVVLIWYSISELRSSYTSEEDKNFCNKIYKKSTKVSKISIFLAIIFSFIVVFIPSKDDMKIIAGISVIENNVDINKAFNETGGSINGTLELFNNSIQLLNKKVTENLDLEETKNNETTK